MTDSQTPPPPRSRRLGGALLRIGTTTFLLAVTLYFVDLDDVAGRLEALDPRWLGAGLALSIPLYALMALRWWFTARRVGVQLSLRRAWLEYYASTFLNRVLPISIAGDAVRVVRHRQRVVEAGGDSGWKPVVTAALLDRVSNQAALALLMAVAGVLWLLRGYTQVAPLTFAGVVVVAGVAAFALYAGRKRLGREGERSFVALAREALVARRALALQFGLSTSIITIFIAMFYCAGRAAGSELDFWTTLQVVPLVLGATVIPLAFSGWGVREATTALLYGFLGLEAGAGVAVAVTFGLLGLVAAAPGLVVLLVPNVRSTDRLVWPARESWAPLAHALWMIAAVAASALFREPTIFVAAGLLAFGVRILGSRGAWTPSGRFGSANALTAARVAVVAGLELAFTGLPAPAFVAIVIVIFLLDGLDGYLARRLRLASAFGAVFDVEADAYFVMLLCLLLWSHDIVGAWVLVAGLWRYVYALVTLLIPARGAAPRSILGRVVYGVLVVSLAGAFLPAPPLAAPLAGVGTVLVTLSFVRSFTWTLRGPAASAGAGGAAGESVASGAAGEGADSGERSEPQRRHG